MGIGRVLFGIGGKVHEDERRRISEVFNNQGIKAEQVKIIDTKSQSDMVVLGNHYHDYKEIYFTAEGEARFILEDIETKERQEYRLNKTTGSIIIPERVAHKVEITGKAMLVGCTERAYIDSEHNDHPYIIE